MAIWRRRPHADLLHHSDQGSQYTAEQFQKLLKDNGIQCSMSRSGECHDNAVMESFFSTDEGRSGQPSPLSNTERSERRYL